jgi:hypothetical protein
MDQFKALRARVTRRELNVDDVGREFERLTFSLGG